MSIRKQGKRLAVYDLELTFSWEAEFGTDGEDTGALEMVAGEIVIKEFATENDEDEYEWTFSVDDKKCAKGVSSDRKNIAKRMISKTKEDILKVLRQYREDLGTQFLS